MKYRISAIAILFTAMFAFTFQACNHADEGNKKMVSKNFESESHNMGQNCMNCHKSGGEGEGWFNVAGTVYDSTKTNTYPNGTVKLYTGPNGTGNLVATIAVDNLGNFYTTESVSFGSGLYPAVQGKNTVQYMGSATSTGQCNSCHGVSTDKLWSK